MTAILQITDGTTTINLLDENGICLNDWQQNVLNYKGGGTFRDSPLADGRRLVDAHYANIIDDFDIKIKGTSQDSAIEKWQELGRLLTKAANYWLTTWQNEPVWIKAQATAETNPRYTLIHNWTVPDLNNPFSQPFLQPLCSALFDGVSLVIEHGPWTADIPGESTCVQTSAEQDWEYTDWELATNQPAGFVYDVFETSSGTLIATDATGPDMWRSTDGEIWVAATTVPTLTPYAVAELDGDLFVACNTAANYGIWRSQDDGINWTQINNTEGASSWNSLIAASDDYLYLAMDGAGNGLFRSQDGISWTKVLNRSGVRCVEESHDGFLYANHSFEIYRSTNGTTWNLAYSHPFTGVNIPDFYGIKEVGIGTDTLLLGLIYYANLSLSEIIRSPDGINWTIVRTTAEAGAAFPGDAIRTSDGLIYLTKAQVGQEVSFSIDGFDWTDINTPAGSIFWTLQEYSGNSRTYAGEQGDIFRSPDTTTIGRTGTCNNEVFISNKQNIAQLTHVKVFDASGPAFTDQFPAAAFPFDLLPDPFVAGDIVYFGIETSVFNSGPFNNLVFDIGDPLSVTGSNTIVWEYWNGAWVTLTVQDNTAFSQPFEATGVNSVHWVPPSDWTTTAIDGITAYWVRVRVSVLGTFVQAPTQQNRDVYTTVWPRIDVDELQTAGDIPPLMQLKAENQSDKDGPSGSAPDAWTNRIVTGLRSLERGTTFTAFLNCADEQNHIGVTATDGANTSDANDIEAPSGRKMQHTTTGASTWTDECTFTLGPSIARDFYGEFHAFVRAQQASGTSGQVRIRLQVKTGTGGVTFTTDHSIFPGTTDWALLDFGKIEIPASDILNSATELPDETQIVIQIWSSAGTITVNLYDLVLMPTDEWAGDFVDKALETDSGIDNGYLLDIDSVTFPKQSIRSLVRTADATGLVRAIYQPIAPGPAVLQANRDQRLWFLAARYSSGSWYSEPWLVHSIQVWDNERYLSMRGAR